MFQHALVMPQLAAEYYVAQRQTEAQANQESAFDGVEGEDRVWLGRGRAQGYHLEERVFDVGGALFGRPGQRTTVKLIQIGHAMAQTNRRIDGDITLKFDQWSLIGCLLRRQKQRLESTHRVTHQCLEPNRCRYFLSKQRSISVRATCRSRTSVGG